MIGLVDSGNNEVVTYTYDAWGKLLSTGGSLASTLGTKNPLRYKDYYYDSETGLYYLQSRYYNPEWGRFISKDDPSYHDGESGAAANLYAYADNNPVMKSDPAGHMSFWVRMRHIAHAIWLITTGLLAIVTCIRATPYNCELSSGTSTTFHKAAYLC